MINSKLSKTLGKEIELIKKSLTEIEEIYKKEQKPKAITVKTIMLSINSIENLKKEMYNQQPDPKKFIQEKCETLALVLLKLNLLNNTYSNKVKEKTITHYRNIEFEEKNIHIEKKTKEEMNKKIVSMLTEAISKSKNLKQYYEMIAKHIVKNGKIEKNGDFCLPIGWSQCVYYIFTFKNLEIRFNVLYREYEEGSLCGNEQKEQKLFETILKDFKNNDQRLRETL